MLPPLRTPRLPKIPFAAPGLQSREVLLGSNHGPAHGRDSPCADLRAIASQRSSLDSAHISKHAPRWSQSQVS